MSCACTTSRWSTSTTDRIVGFEALVRWQHPVRGLVPPLSFIPLAEETGLIVPLGRWVLETACRQAGSWRDARPGAPQLFMSVNLSARQFAQPDLVEQVVAILAETGLDPTTLELEITESVLMDQSEVGIRTLHRLRDMGVRLVLDDFGTGYSSLAYLKHLPLDTIKIDRSFVAGLDGEADRSIVEAVIALAHGLRHRRGRRGHRDRGPVRDPAGDGLRHRARATCSHARCRTRRGMAALTRPAGASTRAIRRPPVRRSRPAARHAPALRAPDSCRPRRRARRRLIS